MALWAIIRTCLNCDHSRGVGLSVDCELGGVAAGRRVDREKHHARGRDWVKCDRIRGNACPVSISRTGCIVATGSNESATQEILGNIIFARGGTR